MVFEWYYGLPSEIHLLFTDWLLRPGPNPFERFIYTWIAFNGWGERVVRPKSDREWVNAIALSGAIGELPWVFWRVWNLDLTSAAGPSAGH